MGSSCKDYFAADVGHVRRRDSVVGSRSRARARRREEKAKVGRRRRGERERETRRAQNGTERVNGVLFDCQLRTQVCLIYYGPRGAHVVRTRQDGGCAHRWTWNSELGTRSSGLRVPLGSAEHGGQVVRGLWNTLDVDPNPNGILPLHRFKLPILPPK